MICSNCKADYTGNFCPECGQKSVHKRYTIKSMFDELIDSVFDFEKKSLLFTIRSLILSPGKSIRISIVEKQRNLYPAFRYLLLTGAMIVVLSLRYHFFHSTEFTSAESENYDGSFLTQYKLFFDGFFRFAEDYATLLNLVAIPIFSLFTYLFFMDYGINFAESLIINTYITAQQLVYLLLLIPFIEFTPGHNDILIPIYTALIMVYNVIVYVQFFGFNFRNILLSIITVVSSFIFQLPVNMSFYYLINEYILPNVHFVTKNQ